MIDSTKSTFNSISETLYKVGEMCYHTLAAAPNPTHFIVKKPIMLMSLFFGAAGAAGVTGANARSQSKYPLSPNDQTQASFTPTQSGLAERQLSSRHNIPPENFQFTKEWESEEHNEVDDQESRIKTTHRDANLQAKKVKREAAPDALASVPLVHVLTAMSELTPEVEVENTALENFRSFRFTPYSNLANCGKSTLRATVLETLAAHLTWSTDGKLAISLINHQWGRDCSEVINTNKKYIIVVFDMTKVNPEFVSFVTIPDSPVIMAFNPDGSEIASVPHEDRKTIWFYNMDYGISNGTSWSKSFHMSIRSIDYLPSAQKKEMAVCLDGKNGCYIINVANRKFPNLELIPTEPSCCGAYSPDGKLLVIATESNVRFYETESYTEVENYPLEKHNPVSISVSPNNEKVAIGYDDGKSIDIFTLQPNGQTIIKRKETILNLKLGAGISFNSDGTKMAVTNKDETAVFVYATKYPFQVIPMQPYKQPCILDKEAYMRSHSSNEKINSYSRDGSQLAVIGVKSCHARYIRNNESSVTIIKDDGPYLIYGKKTASTMIYGNETASTMIYGNETVSTMIYGNETVSTMIYGNETATTTGTTGEATTDSKINLLYLYGIIIGALASVPVYALSKVYFNRVGGQLGCGLANDQREQQGQQQIEERPEETGLAEGTPEEESIV